MAASAFGWVAELLLNRGNKPAAGRELHGLHSMEVGRSGEIESTDRHRGHYDS